MLLEFRMNNVKSFKNELTFKMTPTPKIKDLEYSIITRKLANNKEIKVLPTAIIYGPNAGGKTNTIGGLEIFRSIVLHGNIDNTDNVFNFNVATNRLELIPNKDSSAKEPVSFYIKFLQENMIFEYSIKIVLGKFLDKNYKRKVIEEELVINENMIFSRKEKLSIGNVESILKDYLIEKFSYEASETIAKNNLTDNELFLSGLFKTVYSKKIYETIINWFQKKFDVVYRFDTMEYAPNPKTDVPDNKKFLVSKELNEAAKCFGLSCTEIAYPIEEDKKKVIPLSVISKNGKTSLLPAEIYESLGTIKFLNIFPLIMKAIKQGRTLVIDEFDASIHPMALMSIITIFHNDEINKNGAQLIFNTHNPIFLNKNLFRRDEIHFVERNEQKETSEHYILSDFGTNGENGVRNTEDYMKNYFINKYGAIRDIDFSDIFLK